MIRKIPTDGLLITHTDNRQDKKSINSNGGRSRSRAVISGLNTLTKIKINPLTLAPCILDDVLI